MKILITAMILVACSVTFGLQAQIFTNSALPVIHADQAPISRMASRNAQAILIIFDYQDFGKLVHSTEEAEDNLASKLAVLPDIDGIDNFVKASYSSL